MASNKKDLDTSLDAALEAATVAQTVETPTVAKQTVSVPVNVEVAAQRHYNELESKRKSLVSQYRAEEKFPVTISPFYAPYLGKVVRESVNGIIVDVPADGQTYKINKTHADHIIAKIKRIDAMIARQKRAGDVSNNFEHAPGELHL